MGSARALAFAACLSAAAAHPVLRAEQSPSGCGVSGVVTAGRTPLPGVVVSILDGSERTIDVTSSDVDGSYALKIPGAGTYTLEARLSAFADVKRALTIDAVTCRSRTDLTMTLASRAGAPEAARGAAPGGSPPSTPAARPLGARPSAFQNLSLRADADAAAGSDEAGGGDAAVLLPPGFSPDTSTESVTAIAAPNANDSVFAQNGGGDFAQRFGADGLPGEPGAPGGRGFGGPAGAVGPGAFGGRGGFGGGPFGGGFARGGRGNQIRGSVYQSTDSSALDAAPYALNGQPTAKPDYLQQRFGATIGGPLVIPKVVNSPRTFFFLNYTGNHSRNPYDAYSTVPTAAERAGDFSALGRTIVDPATG